MNKKKFARVLALRRDGVTDLICVQTIIQLSKTATEASIWIDRFYAIQLASLKKEVDDLLGEIKKITEEIKEESSHDPSA